MKASTVMRNTSKIIFNNIKKQIQDILKKFYRYTIDLEYQHISEFNKIVSFLGSLLTALEALSDLEGEDAQRLINEIIKHHTNAQEIINFEQSADFESFQNTIHCLMRYRERLNLAITHFHTHEWEEVLEALKTIDDIQRKLKRMIEMNAIYKKDCEELIKTAPKTVKDKIKTSVKETTLEYSSDSPKPPAQKSPILNNVFQMFRK